MIEIHKKNYEEAMKYFKLANDQENYSRAYKKYYKFTPREYLQINSSRPLDDDATEASQEIEDQGEFFVNSNIQT